MKPDLATDVELGQEVDAAEALSWDRRLWNLETYGDRHGKRRLRRSLRFVSPPVRVELGIISPELEAELRARPGRGRHKQSRADSDALRRFAQSVAVAARRDKRRKPRSRGRPNISKR